MNKMLTTETPQIRELVSRHMLAIAMSDLLIPHAPFRDQSIEFFTEYDGTPHAELRRELALSGKIDDDHLMERVSDDIDLALEITHEADCESFGMDGRPPAQVKGDAEFMKRFEAYREYLYNRAVEKVEGANFTTIH